MVEGEDFLLLLLLDPFRRLVYTSLSFDAVFLVLLFVSGERVRTLVQPYSRVDVSFPLQPSIPRR